MTRESNRQSESDGDDQSGFDPDTSSQKHVHSSTAAADDGADRREADRVDDERVDTLRRRAEAAERATAFLTDRLDEERERREEVRERLDEEREQREAAESELADKRAEVDEYMEARREQLNAEKRRAMGSLVADLLERVWMPLGRGMSGSSPEDLREGIEITREQFRSVLLEAGVEIVEPEPETELDRDRHKVVRTVERPGMESGLILEVQSPGFRTDGEIERRAEVFVVD